MDPADESGLDSLDVQVQVLPNKLRIGKVPKGGLAAAAFPLLNLVLFPAEGRSRFVSLTHTPEELTVIIDQEDVDSFPSDVLQLGDKTFRALQVSEGSTGVTTVGIVQYLSVPLAAAGISIFYLSTYETDFTLIPEDNLSQAMEVVQKHFVGADIDISELGTLPPQKTCLPCESPAQRHPIAMPPGELFLASIKRNQLLTMGTYIMDLLFRTGPTQPFFSYTETEEEVSLILNAESSAIFPPESINVHTEGWRLLKIDFGDKPLGFDEAVLITLSSLSATSPELFRSLHPLNSTLYPAEMGTLNKILRPFNTSQVRIISVINILLDQYLVGTR